MIRFPAWKSRVLLFSLVGLACAAIMSGCQSSKPATAVGSWDYPIRLGDARAKVHELLGNGRGASDPEEYPLSGITLWFDAEGRVAKINAHGPAGEIYSVDDWIISDQKFVFGLSAKANETEFLSILGTPTLEYEERSLAKREIRRVWRRDGYLIDAYFLGTDRAERGRTFPKGALLWFEVSRGF